MEFKVGGAIDSIIPGDGTFGSRELATDVDAEDFPLGGDGAHGIFQLGKGHRSLVPVGACIFFRKDILVDGEIHRKIRQPQVLSGPIDPDRPAQRRKVPAGIRDPSPATQQFAAERAGLIVRVMINQNEAERPGDTLEPETGGIVVVSPVDPVDGESPVPGGFAGACRNSLRDAAADLSGGGWVAVTLGPLEVRQTDPGRPLRTEVFFVIDPGKIQQKGKNRRRLH